MNQPLDTSQTNYNYKTNPYPSLKKKLKNFPFDSITNQIFLSSSTVTDRFQCQKRVIKIAKIYSEKRGSERTVTTGFLVFRVDPRVVYSRMNISSQIRNAVAIFTSVGKHLDYFRRKGPGTRRKQNELQQDPANGFPCCIQWDARGDRYAFAARFGRHANLFLPATNCSKASPQDGGSLSLALCSLTACFENIFTSDTQFVIQQLRHNELDVLSLMMLDVQLFVASNISKLFNFYLRSFSNSIRTSVVDFIVVLENYILVIFPLISINMYCIINMIFE